MLTFPSDFSSSISKHARLFCAFRNNPRLGAANTPFARWLPAEYDDGVSEPKGFRNQTFNSFFLPLVPWTFKSQTLTSINLHKC